MQMLPRTFFHNYYLKLSFPNPTTATLILPNGLTWKVDVVVNTTTTITTDGPQVWFLVMANKKDKGSSSRGGFRETKKEEEEDDDDVSVEEILPEFGSLYKSAERSK
ncbi:hypothetical protein LINGRAHAP2_LOCUS15045 [Linum grandiflorum]